MAGETPCEGARGKGNGRGGPELATDARVMTTEMAMFGETPAPVLWKEISYVRIRWRERWQTASSTVTSERRRRTGGSGMTRGDMQHDNCPYDRPRHQAMQPNQPNEEGGPAKIMSTVLVSLSIIRTVFLFVYNCARTN